MRSSSSTAPGSPTGTWVSSCLRPAAACWPGRCCANWAAPELSIVCFRYAASDAVNAEILLRLRRATRSIPSSTVVAGHLAIRPCFINPRTRLADVDALVDHVTAIGDELTGVQPG